MAAFLKCLRIPALCGILAGAILPIAGTLAATRYVGVQATGYAFGSWGGASPWLGELTQGHFANHSSTWCPADPAAYWPSGT